MLIYVNIDESGAASLDAHFRVMSIKARLTNNKKVSIASRSKKVKKKQTNKQYVSRLIGLSKNSGSVLHVAISII